MLQATTSPYLSALQAAVTNQYRPAKPDIDDFCFICGNRTATGQAYCSDECRQQDEMQSPAPSAVPALVPSSRTGHKSDGSSPPSSATSSPSKIGEGEDEEEDIEKLILPPPVGSYNKRNNFNYGYAYGLATSPVVATAKSLTKSPIVRSTPIQRSKSGQSAGIASPPLAASTETITFRRRPQHDSMNGSKANNAMSPALLARRRPSANQSRPSTATSSSSSPAVTASTSASTSSQTSVSASPAASSLSNILRTQDRSTFAKTPAHIHAQPTCSRMGCPVSSTLPITAFAPLQRRVSEPHSPYASPKICDGVDPFESSFAIHREASVRRISDTTGRCRPSLSTITTAPPAIPLGSYQSQASDYAGFAGFLFARHNQSAQKADNRPDTSESSESGYEAHDEEDRGRRRPSAKKTSSKDGLFMRDLRGNSQSGSNKAAKPSSGLKDKLARVMMSSSSPSDSTTAAAPPRSTRFIFGRGPASKPAVQQASTDISAETQPLSSEEEEVREAKSSAVIAPPPRPKHNHSTSVGEGSQYIVTIRPSQKGQRDSSTRPAMGSRRTTRDSAIATSSSEEDNDVSAVESLHAQETTQERGRTQNRRPSSAARVPLVSPFTALQRAAQGTESRKPDGNSPGPERGRSSQRRSSAAYRSQSPARSHSSASSRSQRRVVA